MACVRRGCPCRVAPAYTITREFFALMRITFTQGQMDFWIRVADEFMIRYE